MAHVIEKLIPDAGLVVLEGAGHYSYADAPGQFRAVARRFLLEQPRELAEREPRGGGAA
jgi:pimeloyl-ACP methyl ester carboxylesterase